MTNSLQSKPLPYGITDVFPTKIEQYLNSHQLTMEDKPS